MRGKGKSSEIKGGNEGKEGKIREGMVYSVIEGKKWVDKGWERKGKE